MGEVLGRDTIEGAIKTAKERLKGLDMASGQEEKRNDWRNIAAGRCSEIKAGDHPSGLAFRSLATFVEGVVRDRRGRDGAGRG